jgi:hypothetical protein
MPATSLGWLHTSEKPLVRLALVLLSRACEISGLAPEGRQKVAQRVSAGDRTGTRKPRNGAKEPGGLRAPLLDGTGSRTGLLAYRSPAVAFQPLSPGSVSSQAESVRISDIDVGFNNVRVKCFCCYPVGEFLYR